MLSDGWCPGVDPEAYLGMSWSLEYTQQWDILISAAFQPLHHVLVGLALAPHTFDYCLLPFNHFLTFTSWLLCQASHPSYLPNNHFSLTLASLPQVRF